MERTEKKHAREVQIVVDKERVYIEGKLTGQVRKARQAEAELKTVQVERRELRKDLHLAIQEKNEMLKLIGRERRQHDVDLQT
jgi:hypothetical protein